MKIKGNFVIANKSIGSPKVTQSQTSRLILILLCGIVCLFGRQASSLRTRSRAAPRHDGED